MTHYFTKNGKDIEMAANVIDLFLKKTGLDKALEIFLNLVKVLFENVQTYPMFLVVKKFADLWLERFITLASALNLKKA